MKVFELKPYSFVRQEIGSNSVYYIFEGCDGTYGKFKEANKEGEVVSKTAPIFFACFADLDKLKIRLVAEPKNEVIESIKSTFKNIKNKFTKENRRNQD